MSELVRPYIDRLESYRPGKPVSELRREYGFETITKLASNENPRGPSPKALAAMQAAAVGVHRYPDDRSFDLRNALSAHHRIAADEIALGHGSNELIDRLVRAFASPQEHAVVGHPSFTCYEICCRASDVPITAVPLRDHLEWDVDDLLAAVRPETKLLFIANPNNPTGAYLDRSSMHRLLTTLPERVIAVVDEAYAHFADAPDFESALELRETRDRLVILRTFSKAYGLAALRVGYAVSSAAIVDYVGRIRSPFNVGSIGQAAAVASLSDPGHLEQYILMNRAERSRIGQELLSRGLRVAPSQANFLLVEVSSLGSNVYQRLLQQGVIVRGMPHPIERWLRISIGLPEENDRLLAALDRIAKERT